MKQSLLHTLVAGALLLFVTCAAPAADIPNSAAILQQLKAFAQTATVLHIAAHPDDENTQLITYLARGRNYRMAYLSVTRGDGGQNLLGPEFGDELGVIRTQELLSARRYDGGMQFFTRARDFGYSKDFQQTLQKWDHEGVVSDIVRVIREFRPDVVITRFPTLPSSTHGHHTASAVVGLEAFKRAGDPTQFPEQLTQGLTVWQPKRIFMNSGGPGGRGQPGGAAANAPVVHMDIGGTDPLTGKSFAEVAGESRAMHKTQGFGQGGVFGNRSGPRTETFQLLAGDPAANDILDGVDTTWARFPGGSEIVPLAELAISQFTPDDPSTIVPILLNIRGRAEKLSPDPVVKDKLAQLDRIITACLGLQVKTTVAQNEVVPGEVMAMHDVVSVRAVMPVKWVAVNYPTLNRKVDVSATLQMDVEATHNDSQTLPADTLMTTPYWLRELGTPGMFRVDDPALIGRPENPPAFPVEYVFDILGQTISIPDEPVQISIDAAKAEVRRRLDVIPPVSISFLSDVQLFSPGTARVVQVNVTAYRPNVSGTIQWDAPADWKIEPSSLPFKLDVVGYQAGFKFTITAPSKIGSEDLTAAAVVNGVKYSNERIEIGYPHIPRQLLQPPAKLKAVSLNLAIAGKNVAYLPGAGDSVAEIVEQMGYTVTPITGADLTTDKLKQFGAVILGVRAFNVRKDLAPNLPALFEYVKNGGTVVEQYNRPDGLQGTQIAPYPMTINGNLPNFRVTDENSPVTFLAPDHPALNTPNKITAADFTGWDQERGLCFPSQWDKTHFTTLIACNDPGEAPLDSGVLIAHDGNGYFVYTGLSFFRQLPAGVPGAVRLFANLVSLGK